MSEFYKARKTYNLYQPGSPAPFKLSRSKIDLFISCPRCFYMDRRLGVSQPPGFPFNLNSAVDLLLKKEFDIHRAKQQQHPLQAAYGLDAVPFMHKDLDIWRENFKGVEAVFAPANLLVTGAVDDLWVNSQGEIIVVDYKATSKDTEVNLDAEWQDGYKRQMEVYQWLLRQKGFNVSATGYFVYCNGRRDKQAFDGKLEFDVKLLSYTGNTDWIEPTLMQIKSCLDGKMPASGQDCDYCKYREASFEVEYPKQTITEEKPVKKVKSVKKDLNGPTLF
jgi:hypothetical protein